jgi:hypothetical protein
MPLVDNAQTTLARLNKVKASRDGVDEAKALEDLLNELLQKSAPIIQLNQNAKVLTDEGVKITKVFEIASAIETIKNVSTRFQESPKSTTLRQGKRWTGLSSKLEAVSNKVAEAQTKDWGVYFENNYFGGPHPTQRSARLAPTPANEKAIKIYRELFLQFAKYRSKIPQDSEDFANLRDLSEQLSQVSFQEDVPVSVKMFFEATSSSSGASLDILTIDVIEWLRNNNLLTNYNVRAKY